MLYKKVIYSILFIIFSSYTTQMLAQNDTEIKKILTKAENLRVNNKPIEAIKLLDDASKDYRNNIDNLVNIHAYKCRTYVYTDSLLSAKRESELSIEYSKKTNKNLSKAMAYFSKAYLNNRLENPEEVVKAAQYGLSLIENENLESAELKCLLNYMLYSAFGTWSNTEKMKQYALESVKYAKISGENNILSNAYSALSSTYELKYEKQKVRKHLDTAMFYLNKSWEVCQKHPKKIPNSTTIITAINFANYFLKYSEKNDSSAYDKANVYLDIAENIIKGVKGEEDKLANIYGIRGEFALQQNNLPLAESFLNTSLAILQKSKENYYTLYSVYKTLVGISEKKGDLKQALDYQKKAEESLSKIFDEREMFNTQKIEIQYETDKKNKELQLLREKEKSKKKQNTLIMGIGLVSLIGLGFMFRAYYFKLRYSMEREKKIAREKEEAERNAAMKMKLEKEEQARLKAERELLEIQQLQLQKEVMANALQIERKNDTLQQIKSKIQEGNQQGIQNLLKEENFTDADFEDVKMQIQKIHPNFFNVLKEKSKQKLTHLDLKYCAYIHLQMSTKQIAQMLHVEAQSVRMFKYRLKQKFELSKEADLETFLQQLAG